MIHWSKAQKSAVWWWWYFLDIIECSNSPVKFSFRVWILRFWKGMPYFMVAGLSKRTSASTYSTVSASNLSIIEQLWKEGTFRSQFLTESLSGYNTEFHINLDWISSNLYSVLYGFLAFIWIIYSYFQPDKKSSLTRSCPQMIQV